MHDAGLTKRERKRSVKRLSNTWAMINRQTGEIKELQSTQERNRGYREKKAKESRTGRAIDFTNANMRHLHEVYDVLTTPQCGYLMLLQCYVGWDDGIIVNTDRSPMKPADMQRVLQLTDTKRSTYNDFMRACESADVINKLNDGSYAINKRYHFKGAIDSQAVIKTYTAKLKRVYREVKASDIGLIYRMLPFVHMSTNALCADPFERDPKKIHWFTQKELAEALGVDSRTLRRRLPHMKFDGMYVVGRFRLGDTERYIFNHHVFYRQDNEPDDTQTAMFMVGDGQ